MSFTKFSTISKRDLLNKEFQHCDALANTTAIWISADWSVILTGMTNRLKQEMVGEPAPDPDNFK